MDKNDKSWGAFSKARVVRIARWMLIVAAALLICLAASGGHGTPSSESSRDNSTLSQAINSQNEDVHASEVPNIARARTIPASELITKIKAGEPVDYDNITIDGDVDLRNLEDHVSQTVKIINATFQGDVDTTGASFDEALELRSVIFSGNATFSNVQFASEADFTGTTFLKETDFTFTKFNSLSDFMGARFYRDAYFRYAQFNSPINFGNVRFDGNISFANAQFSGNAIFSGVRFAKEVDFQLSQFSRPASFMGTSFAEDVDFSNSQFVGTANFMSAQFEGNTSFIATKFTSDILFRYAVFSGDAVFGLASFGGFSDFAYSNFSKDAYFAIAKFTDNAYFVDASFNKDLNMENARIYSMQLDNATFGNQSKIVLTDADFTKFVVHWNILKSRLEYDGAAYLALVKNYKNLEWFDDADDCYYQYRMTERETEPWGWMKIADTISWLSCGYGVRVSYVSFWCIFTILIFGVIFWAGNGMRKFEITGLEVPREADRSINESVSKRVSLVDALYFSVAMFTTSQAPVNNYPVGFYRHLAMVEGILGWFFLGLFIVVLSGVLIR
jgi:hypothetical protein